MKALAKSLVPVSVLVVLALLLSACSSPLTQIITGQRGAKTATTAPTIVLATQPVPVTSGEQPTLAPTMGMPTASAAATPTTDPMNMAMATPAAYSNPALNVPDQMLENDQVKVSEVFSSGPGWVVIYTVKEDGTPDQVIGYAAVPDGDSKNVMVPVDASKAHGTLYVQLHTDAGASGKFEFPGADMPVMVGVKMIGGTFVIMREQPNTGEAASTQTPAVITADQPIKDGKVLVPEIISAGDAWVVIHKANGDGSMGPMVGYAAVKNGVNINVEVPVDTSLTSSTMYVMLHEDNGVKGKLEFPGADVPVMVNGAMIAPQFHITSNSAGDVIINRGSTPESSSFLVDGSGHSLYVSLKDAPGKSNCTGDCLANWQPVIATGRLVVGSGLDATKFGIILLADGRRQVTYLNSPLYTYNKDVKPGDVNGQGKDGEWYLITP